MFQDFAIIVWIVELQFDMSEVGMHKISENGNDWLMGFGDSQP